MRLRAGRGVPDGEEGIVDGGADVVEAELEGVEIFVQALLNDLVDAGVVKVGAEPA